MILSPFNKVSIKTEVKKGLQCYCFFKIFFYSAVILHISYCVVQIVTILF
jgi:hypothetical protein